MKTSSGSRNILTATVTLLAASAIFNLNAATQDRDMVSEKYADTYRTSTEEATQRLAASRDAGRLQQRIATENPETFAGLYIEHSPEFQIVVLFTKDPERNLARYTQSRLYSARVAPRSLETLRAAQEKNGRTAVEIGGAFRKRNRHQNVGSPAPGIGWQKSERGAGKPPCCNRLHQDP